MRKGRSDGPARSGQLRRFMRASGKRTTAIISVLSLLAIGLVLASCGGGGGDSSQGGSSQNISSPSVSGVASAGAPIAGQVTLKDASTPAQQKVTVIFHDGSFALDVAGMKAPFVLEATGNVNGVSCTLLSFASGPGTANINPLSNVALAYAAKVNDPEQIYKNPDPATLDKVKSGLPQAVADILAKLKPLLQNYGADTIDPITSPYLANHTGLDGFFDDVKFTLANGTLTMINAKTGASIFTCAVTDIMGGYFTNAGSPLPNPGPIPAAPTGVTATGGVGQVTVSWTPVSGATLYNLYWSNASGVTTANGTKIGGATSPYVQTGLVPATTYYYIVTAVNSAGESAASGQASATTSTTAPPPPPAAPTGVTATGGVGQVTVSWGAVTGATSYNIYWSAASGVTKTNGTKIAGATSPYVQTGLAPATAYYYIVTAVNSSGESAASGQASATTSTTTPPPPPVPVAPTGVSAVGGTNQVTVSWGAVTGATSYNLYWSATSGVTTATGTKITGATSPYVQTGLAAGTAYYYIVTAVNSVGESPSSAQVTATTSTPAPPPPAFDALTFYNASGNCASCHGAPSGFTGGRTAAQVQTAINSNLGGMLKFNTLTPAQVAAIAAILGP